jgi:hypothetical protein
MSALTIFKMSLLLSKLGIIQATDYCNQIFQVQIIQIHQIKHKIINPNKATNLLAKINLNKGTRV